MSYTKGTGGGINGHVHPPLISKVWENKTMLPTMTIRHLFS